jgi:tRNA dimethylallyltransferase
MHINSDILCNCWILAGPTACGKTSVSLELAEHIGAEIIALDSMSLYRHMDIGTAKATLAERQRVPHHLIDILDPHEEFSVAQYVVAADEACRRIVARGRVPLFVGGTGLYLRAILRGVFEGPPADWDLRRRLEQQGTHPGTLHRRLAQVDPVSARRLHPNDQRRIIRALEICELTGRPASELQQQHPLPPEKRPRNVFWLSPPREWLYERIDARVQQMIDAGLVDEVRGLLRLPQPLSRTARQALGYREVIGYLQLQHSTTPPRHSRDRDPHRLVMRSLADTIEQIQTSTRQFAKRQHTWFRNLEECRSIEMTGQESPAQIVERLLTAADDSAPPPAS